MLTLRGTEDLVEVGAPVALLSADKYRDENLGFRHPVERVLRNPEQGFDHLRGDSTSYNFSVVTQSIDAGKPVMIHAIEKYFSVIGCHDEAFIWLTPTEDYKDSVSYICTNHAGADNSDITAGSWEDLPSSRSIME